MGKHLGAFIGLLIALSGCSSRPATYPVEGKVVWKGGNAATELAGYGVTFESADGSTSGSGEIQADATFTIGTFGIEDGALAGKHRVAVAPPEPESDKLPAPLRIHQRYRSYDTSNLTAEIGPQQRSVVLEVEPPAR